MNQEHEPHKNFAAELMQIDQQEGNDHYENYRRHLRKKLAKVCFRERLTFHLCWVSFLLACVLMFVGGSEVVGSFDPYGKTATPLSITLGVVYLLANITWPIAIAMSLSRYRPRRKELTFQLLEIRIQHIEKQLAELLDRVK